MSHEVLITRGQSILIFFANPGRGRPQHPRQPAPASTGLPRPASAWICKKIKNALSSGYQDLMGNLILTTSPWSVLTWITLTAQHFNHSILIRNSAAITVKHLSRTYLDIIEMTLVLIKLLEKTCSLKLPGKQEIQWDLMRPDQAFYTIAQEHCPKVFAEMTTTAIWCIF